jgi:actin-related protein 5
MSDSFSLIELPPLVINGFDYSHDNLFTDYRSRFAADAGRHAVVIDNGTSLCKAGWASEPQPRMVFEPLSVKNKRTSGPHSFVGNAIALLEPQEVANAAVKTPFVDGLLDSQPRQELVFDYVFARLGIDGDGCVPHPVVCSEPLAAPNRSRRLLCEVLFEVYDVPSIALGVDAMFAFHGAVAASQQRDGLSISIGHTSTQLVPMLDDAPVRDRMMRLDVGAHHVVDAMQRMLLNGNTEHRSFVTAAAAKQLVTRFGYVARDYRAALFALHNDIGASIDERVLLWQLPAAAAAAAAASAPVEAKTAEELAQIDQRRKASSERFRALHDAKKKRKIDGLLVRFNALVAIRPAVQARDGNWRGLLKMHKVDFDGVSEVADQRALDAELLVVGRELVRLEALTSSALAALELCDPDTLSDAELYPLLSRADGELLPAELAIKRRQAARRAGRNQSRQLQAEKQAREAARAAREVEIRANLPAHVASLRHQLQQLRDARAKRQRRVRTESTSRQSESQRRKLAKLATSIIDDQSRAGLRREAMFGASDADWLNYGAQDDGAQSENEKEEIEALEAQLLQWDPTFADALNDDGTDAAHNVDLSRIRVGTERVRCTEVLFDPPQIGVGSAGLNECIASLLQRFPLDERCRLASQVLISGGYVPRGLEARVGDFVVQSMPLGSAVSVRALADPVIASWRGAATCARDAAFAGFMTRAEFNERGSDDGYFREHTWSNSFVPTPPAPEKVDDVVDAEVEADE